MGKQNVGLGSQTGPSPNSDAATDELLNLWAVVNFTQAQFFPLSNEGKEACFGDEHGIMRINYPALQLMCSRSLVNGS